MNTSLEQEEASSNSSHCQSELSRDVETTILSLLRLLKETSNDPLQTSRLINHLEANVQTLMQSYGHNSRLVYADRRVSTIEALVVLLARDGVSTQMIADIIDISPEAVRLYCKEGH